MTRKHPKPSVETNGEPLYEQIAAELRQRIRREHQPGDRLPSEQDLADSFGVHRLTLRRAIDALAAEGMIAKRKGQRAVVLNTRVNYRLSAGQRFTETVRSIGRAPKSELVAKAVENAPENAAKALDLPVGARVVRIDTLRYIDDLPVVRVRHWIPAEPFEPIVRTYKGGSLHGLLESEFGVRLKRISSEVYAEPATPEDIATLFLPPSIPILLCRNLNADESSGRPCEYAEARWRGDAVRFDVSMHGR
ncbi:MAG: phosphonate metabolism transcriptional regulator PhnF [Phycisphaerales bacterium]|nr:phosphonate metabolism transcriptional regulator PhnF [Phycisphaerales bacterium]